MVDLRRLLTAAQPEAFTPDLAMSLGTLGSIAKTSGKAHEAYPAFREGVACLLPYFERAPSTFLPLILRLAQDYIQTSKDAGREIDEELLKPIVEYSSSLPEQSPD